MLPLMGAVGDILLFLHVDCRLAPSGLGAVRKTMAGYPEIVGGNFDARYEGNDWAAEAVIARFPRLLLSFAESTGGTRSHARDALLDQAAQRHDFAKTHCANVLEEFTSGLNVPPDGSAAIRRASMEENAALDEHI